MYVHTHTVQATDTDMTGWLTYDSMGDEPCGADFVYGQIVLDSIVVDPANPRLEFFGIPIYNKKLMIAPTIIFRSTNPIPPELSWEPADNKDDTASDMMFDVEISAGPGKPRKKHVLIYCRGNMLAYKTIH